MSRSPRDPLRNERIAAESDPAADEGGPKLSRRSFLKGAGAAAAVASLLGVKPADAGGAEPERPIAGAAERLGPGPVTFNLRVNGATRTVTAEPRVTLLGVLRDHLGLTGTKLVCDRGACGACTVHLDGVPVTSCMMLAIDARNHEITTIEGLGAPDRMNALQNAFVAKDALQCGFCTPGMMMALSAALDANPNPSPAEIKRAIAGNICRCGTYPHVIEAALAAAKVSRSRA